jgi:hypothetical protein
MAVFAVTLVILVAKTPWLCCNEIVPVLTSKGLVISTPEKATIPPEALFVPLPRAKV